MGDLNLKANLDNVDDFYAALLTSYDGLDENEIHLQNAKLILILANHIGDNNVLEQALTAARNN
ncbi:MAG: DUF2783 domain-containing protein [Salaquimonas sp.]